MRKQTAFLASLAALAAAGLAGCLNNADPVAEASVALPSETSALVAFAADSTRPLPARVQACSVLTEHVAALDTADTNYHGLKNAVDHVCAPHVRPARPDSLRPPKPDSARPVPPAKPDSLRPPHPKPDSLRPVPPAKPDSGFVPPRDPVRPLPPKKPDSTKTKA